VKNRFLHHFAEVFDYSTIEKRDELFDLLAEQSVVADA
jgi:hypothetical protein